VLKVIKWAKGREREQVNYTNHSSSGIWANEREMKEKGKSKQNKTN